jgi:hypothetical protein
MMELLSVKKSNAKDKRLTAKFKIGGRTESVSFGLKGGKTYVDGRSWAEKEQYLARHRLNEKWSDPTTAGSLSRYILWGPHTSLEKNVNSFKKRFKL